MRQEVSSDLCIDWWVDGRVGGVSLTGEIDESNAALLAGILDACVSDGAARIEVDLGGVTFLGAAGVRPLLEVSELLGPGCVVVRRVGSFHRKVIRLCDPEGRVNLAV